MKILIFITHCLAIVMLFVGCSTGKYVLSENGDLADIILKDNHKLECELVSIQDTEIVFSITSENKTYLPRLYSEPFNNIKSIEIKGYDGDGWLGAVLLYQAVPAGLFTLSALSVDSDLGAVSVIFIIPIISAILFSTSDEEAPQWTDDMPIDGIKVLAKYCRYPKTISPDLINQLLMQYNQKGLGQIIIK